MSRRKKIGIVIIALLVVLAVAVGALVSMANKILKSQLEKALGENFKVARIGLSWGTVEAEDVRLIKDGKVTASARKLDLRADFLTIFRKTVAVSSLVLEEPSLQLVIDEQGKLVSPFPEIKGKESTGGGGGEPSKKSTFSIQLRQIVIKNGTFTFQDRRLKAPNKIEARQANARLDNIHYPLSDTVSKISLDMELAGKLLSGTVTVEGTLNFERTGFNLAFDGNKLSVIDLPGSGPQARFDRITFNVSSQSIASNLVELSDVSLQKPYARVLIDKNGKVVDPLRNILPPETRAAGKEDTHAEKKAVVGKEGGARKEPDKEKKAEQSSSTQLVIKRLNISQGEILIIDSKVATPPNQVRLTDVALKLDELSIPFRDTWTTYDCTFNIPGKDRNGVFRTSGKTKFKSIDTVSKASLQGLDINVIKPYVKKSEDADVRKGALGLDIDVRIDNRMIHAPTKAVLREIELGPARGSGDKVMNLPRPLVVNFLKQNNDEIAIEFVVEGNIDDPKFTISESIATRFVLGLAQKLSLAILNSPEKFIDLQRKGLGGLGDALKETTKGLKELLK